MVMAFFTRDREGNSVRVLCEYLTRWFFYASREQSKSTKPKCRLCMWPSQERPHPSPLNPYSSIVMSSCQQNAQTHSAVR